MNILFTLYSKFRTWNKARVKKNKQPLNRENAYALSSIGKKEGHYSDVTKEHQEYVMRQIKNTASLGKTYTLIEHPTYATPLDKEAIVEFVAELGYSICFINGDVILLSWKYSPNDFQMKTIK